MGMNYYFISKNYNRETHKKIFKTYKKDIEQSVELYKKDIKKFFGKLNDLDKLAFKEFDSLISKLELDDPPKLHICKLSYGWKPLLQISNYYSSMTSLKNYYKKHKDTIRVINEDFEDIDFEELIKLIEDKNNNDKNQSHKDYDIVTLVDSLNYEWYDGDFS